MKVAILHSNIADGSEKDEQDVLIQADVVYEALQELGYDPVSLPFSLDVETTIEKLRDIGPTLVFNLVETIDGSGRLIHMAPALLDHLGIVYTGSRTDSIFMTSNKVVSKKLLSLSGIRTPAWFTMEDLRGNVVAPNGRYIVKSVWEHASVGLDENSVLDAEKAESLIEAMKMRVLKLGGDCFVESFIDGREFNISLLAGDMGPELLPAAEILFEGFPEGKVRLLSYRAKWELESFEYRHTMRSFEICSEDEALISRLHESARMCWRIFDLRGYARVDFRVDRNGEPWVLEVNANPCLSPDAGFFAAAQRAGLSFKQVAERIIRDSAPSWTA